MLRLGALDPVDADPDRRVAGTAVHAVLEAWMREDDCDPRGCAGGPRPARRPGVHAMLRALWQPRLMEAVDFIGARWRKGWRKGGGRPGGGEGRASCQAWRCAGGSIGSTLRRRDARDRRL
jgi:hypothetical protein